MRWARTYTTAAENAGRVASYERAQKMGIKLKQEWLATLDGRTRHSHRQLDGERREVGKRFSNGCRYPGDPQAAYAEICNCRCTLVAAVDGIDQGTADRFSRLPAGTTYEQWKAGKAESAHDSTGRTMGEFMQTPLVKKQLAKCGLTEAQGRKLLSEQLKADGATGHQFRTMTKQQQRKAWNGAIAERGITSKKATIEGADVDLNFVRSKAYRSKFDALDVSDAARESIINACIASLTHRTGTAFEDFTLVSLKTGKVVHRIVSAKEPLAVLYDLETREIIEQAEPGELFAIHNHPSNIPPSGSDFVASANNHYGGAVVCLHNGEVYFYRHGDTPFLPSSFDKKVERLTEARYSQSDAIVKVMSEYEGSHGISWARLK